MKVSNFILVPLFAIAAACGGSGSGTPGAPHAEDQAALPAPSMSNAEIAWLVYDPDYDVPPGFYRDARAATDRSYTIHHVLDDSESFELCTDDYQTAVNWEAADNAARAVNGVFVSTAETDRYFEFVRELEYTEDVGTIDEPTSPGFARVFKCSNTSRDGVDRSLLNGFAGRINARPVDAGAVREFTEYLWQFRFFATGRRVVLESRAESSGDAAAHVLRIAFRNRQGPGLCDRIEIADWRFSADHSSGDVQKTFTTVRSFEAQLVDGAATLCD